MRTMRTILTLVVALLLAAGSALAQGEQRPIKTYLPQIKTTGSSSQNAPPAPTTPVPAPTTPVPDPTTPVPDPTTPVPDPTTPVPTPSLQEGTWGGSTSQGRPFSFTVANGAITSLSFGYSLPGCGVTGTITDTFTPGLPIVNNAFTYTSSQPPPSAFVVTVGGTFSSATTAGGTLQGTVNFTSPPATCSDSASATWTATPGGATPTPTPPTPTPEVRDYNGVWWGVTSQGKPIGFTVANNALSVLEFGYIAEGSCTSTGSIKTTYTTPKPITGDSLSESSPGFAPSKLAFSLAGSFSSDQAISGTLNITLTNSFPNPPCSASATVSWSAAKGAPQPNPDATATLKVLNNTGGSLSFTLTGPTTLSTAVPPGNHYVAIVPGSYQIAATAGCGSRVDSFTAVANRLYSQEYFCVTVPAATGPGAGLATVAGE